MKLTVTKGLQSEIYTPTTPPPVWTPLKKPINKCKVALASACGAHPASVKPFRTSGDSSLREVPSDLKGDEVIVTHGGYDNTDVNKDINCMFPFERIKELKEEGFIGDYAAINVGFMGGGGLIDEFTNVTGPKAAQILKDQDVDICILTAG